MARKTSEELNAIKKRYNVDDIYSWSRFNCYKTSKFEYLLNYIQKAKRTRASIYGNSGNFIHDTLEAFYRGEIEYDDMLPLYEEALYDFSIAELKYDRSDDKKNNAIAKKYEANIRHFFENHKVLEYKLALEKFVLIKVGEFLLQGYIDVVYKDEDGNFNIIDWKSSSLYRGKKIDEEKGQLMLYGIALNQQGVPWDKIKLKWNFLKYTDITFMQKNGKERTMTADRCEIAKKLKNRLLGNLRDEGMDEIDVQLAVAECVDNNSLKTLPQHIQDLYTFDDCYVDIPFNDIDIQMLKDDIVGTLREIEDKTEEYLKTKDNNLFWDSPEHVKKQSYYFANLCSFSPNQHLPYKEYLDNIQSYRNEGEQKSYDNIGSNSSDDWMKELGL